MLFTHHIKFKKIDPLGDGLREEIQAEQLEPEAIRLDEEPTEDQQRDYWDQVQKDIADDPEWFHFSQD